jgi:hypothetical protein
MQLSVRATVELGAGIRIADPDHKTEKTSDNGGK